MTANTELTHKYMAGLISTYFDGCNEANIDKMVACFVPEAVHYFPPGMYQGPFVGAENIAKRWVGAVETFGSVWTIDSIISDPASARSVIEWSHFKTYESKLLRGDEWYEFDRETGLIREIRAYYASPQDKDLGTLELGGFDYLARGYALEPPVYPRPGAVG